MILRIVLLSLALLATSSSAAELGLRFIGQQVIPTGTESVGTILGGLSGIDYDPAADCYVAISDDRSQYNAARFYTIDLALSASAFSGVTINAAQTIKQLDGTPYPKGSIDPESIRHSGNGDYLYVSEGDANAGIAPFVREMASDGRFLHDFAVPSYYLPSAGRGIRNNLSFESVALSPDGADVIVGTENALAQDGPEASQANGSLSRLLIFDRATGAPKHEYVYQLEPAVIPSPQPIVAFAMNGLVDLLALDGSKYLALERAFFKTPTRSGTSIRLFLIDLAGATDVMGKASLKGQSFKPVSKTLVLDLATLGIPLDNLEGMTFGETLENGNRSLIMVADNNFSKDQITQFLAFEVTEGGAPPSPSTIPKQQ